jgi:ABC-type branched-subunit amino acid transport system substrate-binding protein
MRKLGKLCLVFLALVALLSVLAVACGGGGDKKATPTAKPTVAATAKATVAATAKATATATAKPTTAATATATAVATAKPTTSPTTSTTPTAVPTTPPTVGPTTTPPPSAYDPTNPDIGITDTEIILGTHFSLTGIYGNAFGPVLKGMKAYFAYVNTELGGIAACGNRKIVLKVENDDYEAAKAPAAVRKLVEQEHVFAIVAGLGTAAHSAVWEYLNEKGIPDLWIMSGAHKWAADPVAHPWSYAILPDYYVEGTIFGKYISENLPGKKVGVIYQNDDYGKDELAGVKNGLDSTKNELVSEQPYDALAIDIRAQVNKLKSDGAEVVVGGGIPGHMAQLIKGAYQMDWHPQFFIGYVNSSTAMFVYAQPNVEAMDGVLTLQGNKMDWWTDDPAIAEHHRLMDTYSDETPSSNSVMGQITGEATVEVLAEACNRGDLTRQGVIDVVNSIKDEQSDLRLDGITVSFSATDHSAVEAMKFLRAHVVDGVGTYEYEGDFVSFR